MSSAGRDALVAMLSRLKNDLQGLSLSRAESAQAVLQAKYPLGGDYLVEVRRLCQRGVEQGWLLAEEADGVRFSRLSKPAKHFPFSVDAVRLDGTGRGHAHPKGEVNLAWALDGKPRFCGQDPGWVVFAPGSRHVPVVTGGSMFLLYFLPNGEIAWEPRPAKSAAATAAEKARGAASRQALAAARAAAPRASATTKRAARG